jgi:hypothetical protein
MTAIACVWSEMAIVCGYLSAPIIRSIAECFRFFTLAQCLARPRPKLFRCFG